MSDAQQIASGNHDERVRAYVEALQRENAALREENRKAHDMACEDAVERYRLNGENAALRNKLAALENQTQWKCSCGGTDCEGQKENAALRKSRERLVRTASEVLEAFVLHKKVETGHPCPENMCICIDLRAAIDAARAKEDQP